MSGIFNTGSQNSYLFGSGCALGRFFFADVANDSNIKKEKVDMLRPCETMIRIKVGVLLRGGRERERELEIKRVIGEGGEGERDGGRVLHVSIFKFTNL